ncbi:MAG: phosphoribosylanthranilate isomerase [Ardenticatenaceae bacterium]|nr:phosphoribosylanthranilate isomerase [Anaerolineales bacterium]MCB8923850.1 phosphoribosylanthranilate isomerase [Ardenticatenaceae bacterium]MCB9003371.1 phosphoribosylanthranilate isomerase [Ardenticatenaceae bacterium]
MKVKICGFTRLEDAVTAVTLGADMLGFNFYKGSKRYITPEKAADLIHHLRHDASRITHHASRFPILVGIFVNSPLDEVQRIMALCGLDLAQLCGDEPPEMLHTLGDKAFKAIRPSTLPQAQTLMQQFARPAQQPAILIDAYQPGEYGGGGQTGDWALAAHFASSHAIMLAGGLTPENVGTAVTQTHPWGVDVASGVESAPGVKDAQKMAQFITKAKEIRD